jgi:hypothetical protein
MDIHPPGFNIFNWFRAEHAITRALKKPKVADLLGIRPGQQSTRRYQK